MSDGSPRLTRADVQHVARLARLALTEQELDEFTEQLAVILDHANDVAALAIDDVPPTAHPLPLLNVFRDDVPRATLDRDEVLASAPDVVDMKFRVPKILGERA